MSVTVGLVPTLLLFAIGGIVASKAKSPEDNNTHEINDLTVDYISHHFTMEEIEKLQEKEIDTVFVDKNTLTKTLEEYGANIVTLQADKIECQLEGFEFIFFKTSIDPTSPYKLKIKYNREDSLQNLINDIHSEYISNSQEASYNKVVERLKEKNMKYEEEVYDDDTIVLTVNLD